jgi:hypothetical protein
MKKTMKKSGRKVSARVAFARQHTAAIKAEQKRRGMKGIKSYNVVLNEMFLASGGKMAPKRVPKGRKVSNRRQIASAKSRLAKGGLSPTLEQKLRALFVMGSPSKYSSSGRFRGSKKMRKMRTKKVRKASNRKPSAVNNWFAAHKAEINAARGKRNFVKVAWEMYKAAHPNFVAKSKMPKVKKAKKSPKAKKSRKGKKTSRKGKKSSRKTRSKSGSRKMRSKSGSRKMRTMKARRGKSRLGRKSRAAKKVGSRKPSAYNLKVKQYMAAARAAHPSMKPMAAAAKYIRENKL